MRYKITEGSDCYTCNFPYAIVDTSEVVYVDGGNEPRYKPRSICECYRKEDAQLICNALNAPSEKYEFIPMVRPTPIAGDVLPLHKYVGTNISKEDLYERFFKEWNEHDGEETDELDQLTMAILDMYGN